MGGAYHGLCCVNTTLVDANAAIIMLKGWSPRRETHYISCQVDSLKEIQS